MNLLRAESEVVRPLIDHLRLLVGGDELDRTLARLGLLDDTLSANQEPGDCPATNPEPTDAARTNQEARDSERTNPEAGSGVRTNQKTGNGGTANKEAGDGQTTNHGSALSPEEAVGVSECLTMMNLFRKSARTSPLFI